ncbi:MAG TPA: hypothetical protein ENF20_05050, partial [Candidatus Marinimicrobia bacterium]|nr:hypothetical protein [Candidatus Neomarinimicrobiota bacterium]
MGPEEFDCSGLCLEVVKQFFGVNLPRTSTDQFKIGKEVTREDLEAGDLVFFDTGWTQRKPNHNGIYIGKGEFVNANSYHGCVVKDNLFSAYWEKKFYGARRVGKGVRRKDLQQDFLDVSPRHPSYSYISHLYQKKIIQGHPDGTFKPNQGVNRAELLKIVFKSFHLPILKKAEVNLRDVSKQDWFYEYVATALKKNIIKGYPDKTFKPGNKVNRAEALKMILKSALKRIPLKKKVNLEDVKKTDWFYRY